MLSKHGHILGDMKHDVLPAHTSLTSSNAATVTTHGNELLVAGRSCGTSGSEAFIARYLLP